MNKAKTVMIIAGEASGDMHGASLVREMLKINPSLNGAVFPLGYDKKYLESQLSLYYANDSGAS
ncbi:MAG: hypothetical protein HGB33_04075 [Syntrophaceae bacterium]|nr:hypothetical protein [Syntrophaceae bacterium]